MENLWTFQEGWCFWPPDESMFLSQMGLDLRKTLSWPLQLPRFKLCFRELQRARKMVFLERKGKGRGIDCFWTRFYCCSNSRVLKSASESRWEGKREDDDERLYKNFIRKMGIAVEVEKPRGKLFRTKMHNEYYTSLLARGVMNHRTVDFPFLESIRISIRHHLVKLEPEDFCLHSYLACPELTAFFESNLSFLSSSLIQFTVFDNVYENWKFLACWDYWCEELYHFSNQHHTRRSLQISYWGSKFFKGNKDTHLLFQFACEQHYHSQDYHQLPQAKRLPQKLMCPSSKPKWLELLWMRFLSLCLVPLCFTCIELYSRAKANYLMALRWQEFFIILRLAFPLT